MHLIAETGSGVPTRIYLGEYATREKAERAAAKFGRIMSDIPYRYLVDGEPLHAEKQSKQLTLGLSE